MSINVIPENLFGEQVPPHEDGNEVEPGVRGAVPANVSTIS